MIAVHVLLPSWNCGKYRNYLLHYVVCNVFKCGGIVETTTRFTLARVNRALILIIGLACNKPLTLLTCGQSFLLRRHLWCPWHALPDIEPYWSHFLVSGHHPLETRVQSWYVFLRKVVAVEYLTRNVCVPNIHGLEPRLSSNHGCEVRNCHTIDTHEMKWSIGRGDAFVYKAKVSVLLLQQYECLDHWWTVGSIRTNSQQTEESEDPSRRDDNGIYGGFLRCWYPATMGFPTKKRSALGGVKWGYHHLRKHRYMSRWWFQTFFIFTPICGEMIQFD